MIGFNVRKITKENSRKNKKNDKLDIGLRPLGMRLIMTSIICLSAISFAAGGLVPVRLVHGTDNYRGRLEVFYNGSWGTVCDDKMSDENCAVVCNQLGFSGGRWIDDATTYFGEGTGVIWLDDVNCSGTEPDLNACLHTHWGVSNCQHKEDTGCQCDSALNPPVLPPIAGTCDSNRHRIWPFDPRHPGIGRAEVQGRDGLWYSICDDGWDDVDAAVFCSCLGYTDRSHFRAFWNRELDTMTPLDMLYSSVHCKTEEMNSVQNIWQCKTKPYKGNCDLVQEAAAIACQPLPPVLPPAPPAAHLDCNGDILTVCYTSTDYKLQAKYLDIDPTCIQNSVNSIEDGICINIPLHQCKATETKTDPSSKDYCYDVHYTEPSTLKSLIVGNTWVRSACCSVAKNGSVLSSFIPHVQEQAEIQTAAKVNFTVGCYLNDDFHGEPLTFPINITRGQDMFCRVSVDTYDDDLQLIVPDCRFMARKSGSPSFTFIQDKCPTSSEFGIHYYNSDGHNWGFKFRTPQFQGYKDLYLSCDCYVCDPSLDAKPYCDRSCKPNSRKKRSSYWRRLDEVDMGPLQVQDSSAGPLIDVDGFLLNNRQILDGKLEDVDGFLLNNRQILDVLVRAEESSATANHLCLLLLIPMLWLLF